MRKESTAPRTVAFRWELLVLVCITTWCCCSTSVQSNHHGYTTPTGAMYVLVDRTIEINCTISLKSVNGRNSSSLRWFNLSGPVDSAYVHTLSASTAMLRIPNARPTKDTYICKIHNASTDTYMAIDYNELYVGSAPMHVRNFECRSHNWVNMTCTFARVPNFVDSTYTLQFRVDRNDQTEYECQLIPLFDGTYTCSLQMDSKSGIYRQAYQYYYFHLFAKNPLGSLTEEFEWNHYSSVIPDAPTQLINSNVTPNSATLTWRAPLEMQSFPEELLYSVTYTSPYDHNVWHEMPARITAEHKATVRYELTDLPYAYGEYDVRVRVRVRSAANTPEMWSRNASIIFHSGARIPDAPPATDAGGFYVDDNNHVFIYWRELAKHDENGPNFGYVVRSPTAVDLQRQASTATFMAKYTNVRQQLSEDIWFEVSSVNAQGASANSSRIRVPRRAERCASPGEIRNILHRKNQPDRHYVFSWSAPQRGVVGQDDATIVSYTVFWCRARNESPNQCDGGFDFTRVAADTTSYTHTTNDTLNFAVAANSATSSSGMTWARCTAIADNDINKVTDAKPTVGSDTATFEWNTACIDESLSHGYLITYCLVRGERDNSNCSEPPHSIEISGAAIHNYTIRALTPYRTYQVNIAAMSAEKIGPLSDSVYFTTLEASPSPPRSLMVLEVSNTTLKLKWDAPELMNGVLNRYVISYNSLKLDVAKTGSARDAQTFVLTGLAANTDYQVTIRACTGASQCSNSSNTVDARTDVGTPGVVRLAGGVGGEVDVIRWHEPLQAGGNLDYYELEVLEHDGGDGVRRRVVLVNGTRCTVAIPMCSASEQSYSFRVRAVNVLYSAHGPAANRPQHQLQQQVHGNGGGGGGVAAAAESVAAVLAGGTTAATVATLLGGGGGGGGAAGGLVHGVGGGAFGHVCVEEDVRLFERIRKRDQHATPFAGDWVVVKNQDCRTTNRTMFVLASFVFVILVCSYMGGAWGFKKLNKMKDIAVELPEGLQDIAQEPGRGGGGGVGGGMVGVHKHGRHIGVAEAATSPDAVGGSGGLGAGIGMGNGGIGMDVGRVREPLSMMAAAATERLLLSEARDLDDALLPMMMAGGEHRSRTRSDMMLLDDGVIGRGSSSSASSSSSQSQCEDSDGGGHDGSSGRTLLMGGGGANSGGGSLAAMDEYDKYIGIRGSSPIIGPFASSLSKAPTSSFTTKPQPPLPPMNAVQIAKPQPPPTPHPSVVTNANGYVTHESCGMMPPSVMSRHLAQQSAAAAATATPAPMSTTIETAQPIANAAENINGYLPWNALTAAAVAAAADHNATAAGVKSKHHAMGVDVAAAAEKTGISGYVTHKQLSDFGQLMH